MNKGLLVLQGFCYVLKLQYIFVVNLAVDRPATARLYRKGVHNLAFGKIGKQDAFKNDKQTKNIGSERIIIHKKIYWCATANTAICHHLSPLWAFEAISRISFLQGHTFMRSKLLQGSSQFRACYKIYKTTTSILKGFLNKEN
jgi:hypothetical protein